MKTSYKETVHSVVSTNTSDKYDGRYTESQKSNIAVLRIIACAAVFFIHYGQKNRDVLPPWFINIVDYGQDGLWIFYILSGMLGMYSYSRKVSRGGARRYYIERVLRICPAAYFWLIMIYITYAIPFFRQYYTYTHSPLDWQWLISVFFLNSIIPTDCYSMWNGMSILGTLGNFMMFYLLVPLLYKFICNLRRAVVFFIFACIIHFPGAVFYRNILIKLGNEDPGSWPGKHFFVCVLWYFALGMVLYHVQKSNRWKTMLLCAIVAFLACIRYDFLSEFYIGSFLTVIISAAMLVKTPTKNGRHLLKVERYTFSLFLCHVFVFRCMEGLQKMLHFSSELRSVFDIVFPIVAAILTYHLVCRPFDKIRSKLSKKWEYVT